jgi:ribonucleoside-triphosphate reductase
MLNTYASVIHKSRYARFLDDKKRRETWEETVERYVAFITQQAAKLGGALSTEEIEEITQAIVNREVMPSMRLMMTAGEAATRDNIAGYNCAYLAVNNKRAFSETLYVLMNGTGVGFSCERQEIGKLPKLPGTFKEVDDVIVVGDSKLGWAKAYRKLLSSLWDGDVPRIDYSRVRAAGERLRTFGGRASGPAPLQRLFDYSVSVFKGAAGRNLNSLEVHDIMCTIGEVVVVGGVRRSALISLSNLTDRRMREAKTGAWWEDNPQRALANNSVAYTEKPDSEAFLEEWLSLVKSKSGERGIFNRVAAQKQAASVGRDPKASYGCNP